MKFVAVTACPAGLAHTFMGAAALKNAAKRLGVDIKVETQGAMGITNELKINEISEADVVIFAADTKVTKVERFDNKPIIKVPVSETLKNPEKIIKDAIAAVNS